MMMLRNSSRGSLGTVGVQQALGLLKGVGELGVAKLDDPIRSDPMSAGGPTDASPPVPE